MLCFLQKFLVLLPYPRLCPKVFDFAPLSKVETLLKDLRQSGSQDTTYPKLRMAVETGQKEFVGHVYSQQVVDVVLIIYCSHDGVI